MTKVDKLLAEDRQRAIDEAVEKTKKDVTKSVTKSVTKNVTEHIAENMIKSGDSPEKVSHDTGLSIEVVKKLIKSIEKASKGVAAL